MGALYHLKQKLVDFCNVIQENVSRTDTVPSSKVVYDLSQPVQKTITSMNQVNVGGLRLYKIGRLCVIQGTLHPDTNLSSWSDVFSIDDITCEPLGAGVILSLVLAGSNMYLEVLKSTNPVRVQTAAALTANKTYKVAGCWLTVS